MVFRSGDRARRKAEGRLAALSGEIDDLRSRLAILDEQVGFLSQVESDAATDAVVGDTPVHAREHRSARSDLERTRRERDEVRDAITERLAEQNRLLDRLLD